MDDMRENRKEKLRMRKKLEKSPAQQEEQRNIRAKRAQKYVIYSDIVDRMERNK